MRTASFIVLFIGAMLAACTIGAPILDLPPFAQLDNVPTPTPAASPRATSAPRAPLTGQLVFAAEREGRWDVYVASPSGGAWQRLTDDGSSRRPAVSRDGKRIAFESHRDGNWEIYAMDVASAQTARVTRLAAYDGEPAWSPDGTQLAFASARQGDLDIWLSNADGSSPRDLTPDSPAVDHSPAWSPDGRWIAFTSWRNDRALIFVISPDGQQSIQLSQGDFDDQSPAWSPDGRQLAFVSDRDGPRAIYIADFSTNGFKNVRRLTFSGWDDLPAWSPDGKYIAFVSPRPARQPVYIVPAVGGASVALSTDAIQVQSVAWATVPALPKPRANSPAVALYPRPSPDTRAELVPLRDVYLAPSYGRLSDRISGSYQALRARVKAEAGWDFLSVLSDMARQLTTGPCGDGCDYMSWHKAGRAFDTRLIVESGGMSMIEVVREDQLGETYWRMYLRAAKQDGTMGAPLTEAPWDWTNTARWTIAPGQGGVTKPIPPGYYVDFTELARLYGWERISSYDDEFSWKNDKTGMEFWHFQSTDGLTWYRALGELYANDTLTDAFDWNGLLQRGEEPYRVQQKDVPAPPDAWRWFTLF